MEKLIDVLGFGLTGFWIVVVIQVIFCEQVLQIQPDKVLIFSVAAVYSNLIAYYILRGDKK